MNALARGELTGFVFALAALRASTGFGFLGNAAKLVPTVAVPGFGKQTGLGLRQRVLPRRRIPSAQKCARRDALQSKRFREAAQRQRATPRPWERHAAGETRARSHIP